MQARVRRVALPVPKLPATHEYQAKPEPPEGWEEQQAAQRRRKAWEKTMQQKREASAKATAKKAAKDGTKAGFHMWTNEEREYLRQQKAAGRSWTELGAEFGVSRGAVRMQAARGRE